MYTSIEMLMLRFTVQFAVLAAALGRASIFIPGTDFVVGQSMRAPESCEPWLLYSCVARMCVLSTRKRCCLKNIWRDTAVTRVRE